MLMYCIQYKIQIEKQEIIETAYCRGPAAALNTLPLPNCLKLNDNWCPTLIAKPEINVHITQKFFVYFLDSDKCTTVM